jgi:futalosine hydrolase
MKYIAILSSISQESDLIRSKLSNIRKERVAEKTVFRGKHAQSDLLLMNSGIGKVNAAHSTTALIERYPVSAVLNIGIGGAHPSSGLVPGDMAIATKEIYADEGVIGPRGWQGMKEIGIPLLQIGDRKRYNEIPLDKPLAGKCLKSALRVGRARAGHFVTVSGAAGTRKRAIELEKRFGAVCENMEGAAIAHVCAIYKIPFLEIRGISNIVGVRDKRRWKLKVASEKCQLAVLDLIENVNMLAFA